MKKINSRKESFIGIASESDLRIAMHYADAFKILYNSKQYQDHIVIPALFLVRQFLELGFKYNIKKLSTISGSKNLLNTLSDEHDLNKLYCSFLEHYKSTKNKRSLKQLKDGNMLSDLKLLVELVLMFDNKSMGYRYSTDKDENKQIDLNATYDLEKVNEVIENVQTFLSSVEDVFGL